MASARSFEVKIRSVRAEPDVGPTQEQISVHCTTEDQMTLDEVTDVMMVALAELVCRCKPAGQSAGDYIKESVQSLRTQFSEAFNDVLRRMDEDGVPGWCCSCANCIERRKGLQASMRPLVDLQFKGD